MSLTITLQLWWLLAYLAVGVVLVLPLEWLAWRSIHHPPPFWRELARGLRRRPWMPLVAIAVWPYALIEAVR